MAYAQPNRYVSLSGTLRGGERFSIGVRCTNAFVDNQSVEQDRCDALAAAVSTWWAGNNGIGNNAVLDTVKWNLIGVDGRYVNDYTTATFLTTPVPAGGAASPHPNQIALVATLTTNATRGLASRGRMFMPAPVAQPGADGRITAAEALTVANGVKNLLVAIDAVEGIGIPVIASNVGAGQERFIRGVEVGRVLDTMRSRRTSLDEDRQAVALPS